MAEPDTPMTPTDRRRLGLRRTAARAGSGARAVLRLARLLRAILWQAVQVLVAIVVIFEEWGWRPLSEALSRIAYLKPIAMLEGLIVRLPPYPALGVFALPTLLLLPLKLVALWLIAQGHVVMASLLFIGAKIAGTAIFARILMLTQPALMQLGWFARLYHLLMPWKEALVAQVRTSWVWRFGRIVKARVKHAAAVAWTQWRPSVEPFLRRVRAMIGR